MVQTTAMCPNYVSFVNSYDQLVDTVRRLGSGLESTEVDGGAHPRFGKHSFIIPLHRNQYVEVVYPLNLPVKEQTHSGKAVSKREQESESCLTSNPATKDISKGEEKFKRRAIEGHPSRSEGSNLKWKQVGVHESTNSRELPTFIEWLTPDRPSQDGKAVAMIEKIATAGSNQLSDSWSKAEILGGLNCAKVEFINPSPNDGEYGIVMVHSMESNGFVRQD